MKTKETMEFRVDTVALLHEIVDCALKENQGVLKLPLNIFRNLLAQAAQRAIELNDPRLNIIMLNLGLYEVSPQEIVSVIEQQKQLLKELENEQV